MSDDRPSVLVAVDFGEASARAVAVAGFIAQGLDADLRLLHAESLEAPVYFTEEQLDSLERQRQATRKQAEAFLREFGQRNTPAPLVAELVDRPPVDAILSAAATADLVVMGTHGRSGPRRWWLGSVAERVLRDIARPLLIVRAEMTQPVSQLLARALVHTAAPAVGVHALEYARDLAGRFGGTAIDARGELVDPTIERANATILVVAAPQPRSSGWLSNYGEPLVRFCTVPILFVPEIALVKENR